MGVDSTALGFIGGAIGDQLENGLIGLGIQTDFIRVMGETRINLSVVAGDHTHYIKVNEPGPIISVREMDAMLDKISSLIKPGDWWIIAGSSPPGIPSEFITNIINLVQSANAKAVLDIHGAALLYGCKSGAFLVKPNAREAGELTSTRINSLNHAFTILPKIHALGAQQVVIS